jgi:hypothetical protein
MSKLSKNSHECGKSELNLMFTPPTQAMITGGYYVDIYPLNNIDNNTPIEFEIKGSKDEYIDHGKMFLHVIGQIVDDVGNNIANTTVCAPVNNMAHSLYQQVQVEFNNTPVNSPVNSYSYLAYLSTLLNYGTDAKNSHLKSCLWAKDTAEEFDNINPSKLDTSTPPVPRPYNVGFVERSEAVSSSEPFEMYSRLHVEAFNTHRLLLNLVDIKIKLTKQKSSFCLMGNDKLRVKFLQAVLYVRKVLVNPDVVAAHQRLMETNNAQYPIKRTEIKNFPIVKGLSKTIINNLTNGTVPSRVVFGLVLSKSYEGDYSTNPYNFQHFNATRVALIVDGKEVDKPFELDYSKDKFTRAYHSLFTAVSGDIRDNGLDITKHDYKNGNCLYAFDLSADLCNSDHFNLVKIGNSRLEIDFSKGVSDNVTVVVYLEYENIIEINKNRKILFDYTL